MSGLTPTDPSLDPYHKKLFDAGVAIRREVLGAEYVDRSLGSALSEFSAPSQDFMSEIAWGTVWTRPQLARRDRSLINLAWLIAMKAWTELALHTKGAIRNGLTETEIREVVLQAKIYCGVPCGVEAMRVCERSINEMVESGEHVRELKEKVERRP